MKKVEKMKGMMDSKNAFDFTHVSQMTLALPPLTCANCGNDTFTVPVEVIFTEPKEGQQMVLFEEEDGGD
jgi:hypothetical protein